jgi:hypothetical protein
VTHVVPAVTVVLALLSVATGVFLTPLLRVLVSHVTNVSELRWILIAGMPLLLSLYFIWINRQPATNLPSIVLQCSGQFALFIVPYIWIFRSMP